MKKEKSLQKRIRQWIKEYIKQFPLQLMVLPGILFMIIFSYIPIYGLSIAFKNYTVVSTMRSAAWVGFENFEIILKDRYFWDSVTNTLAISFLKLLFGFVTPILLAVMIYEIKDGPFKRIVQTISYLPHFLSWIVLGGMLISWMSTNGMFNQILMGLGIIKEGKNILLDADKYWWIASLSDQTDYQYYNSLDKNNYLPEFYTYNQRAVEFQSGSDAGSDEYTESGDRGGHQFLCLPYGTGTGRFLLRDSGRTGSVHRFSGSSCACKPAY